MLLVGVEVALKHLGRVIALVGLPGSGKSTVGRQLARRHGLTFLDSDALIEKEIGCSIKDFFDEQGEAAFRDKEARVLAALISDGEGVLSTGGGAVLRAENRRALHDGCHAVYLRSAPEEIFRRLRHDRTRPLLQVADPLKKLQALYEERDPLYREVAHFTIETGRPSVATLVNMISMQLELAGFSLSRTAGG